MGFTRCRFMVVYRSGYISRMDEAGRSIALFHKSLRHPLQQCASKS